jgi:flagellar motor component MotA
MLGFALAGRRLGAWPGILADLRRAGQSKGRARSDRRAAYLRDAETQPLHSFDFAHLDGVLRITRETPPAETDRVVSGGIALFREKSRQRIAVVEQTVRDAYAGSAIALIFGVIHMLENLDEPLPVLGHLMGGALCASFFGVILGRAVLAPIASQLAALHEQQAREMDALRLSLSEGEVRPFPAETFEVLASGLVPQV